MAIKIIRSICYFSKKPSDETVKKLSRISDLLIKNDYEIQTKRICASNITIKELGEKISDKSIFLNVGTIEMEKVSEQIADIFGKNNIAFNLDLSKIEITKKHTDV